MAHSREVERLRRSGVFDTFNEIERVKRTGVFEADKRIYELEQRRILNEERYLDKLGRREIEKNVFDTFERLRNAQIPPFADPIHTVNHRMFKMLEEMRKREHDYLSNVNLHKEWERQFNVFENRYTLSRYDAVESHIARITQMTSFAESSLLSISQDGIGLGMKVSEVDRSLFKSNFQNLSDSYKNLIDSFTDRSQNLFSVSPEISRLSAVEYFNATDLIVSVSPKDRDEVEFDEEKADIRENIYLETQDILDYLLSEIDQNFISMRYGAREALESKNPDRVRHFAVSYRELFTKVIHKLAPDNEVKDWTSDKEFFSNGRPTRKARMLYIYRNNIQSDVADFFLKDIEATLETINLFQKGTHATDSGFTEFQLKALEIRLECSLRILLESGRTENSKSLQQNPAKSLENLIEDSEVDTGIPDLASQHDHYLYGKPKK